MMHGAGLGGVIVCCGVSILMGQECERLSALASPLRGQETAGTHGCRGRAGRIPDNTPFRGCGRGWHGVTTAVASETEDLLVLFWPVGWLVLESRLSAKKFIDEQNRTVY